MKKALQKKKDLDDSDNEEGKGAVLREDESETEDDPNN